MQQPAEAGLEQPSPHYDAYSTEPLFYDVSFVDASTGSETLWPVLAISGGIFLIGVLLVLLIFVATRP